MHKKYSYFHSINRGKKIYILDITKKLLDELNKKLNLLKYLKKLSRIFLKNLLLEYPYAQIIIVISPL